MILRAGNDGSIPILRCYGGGVGVTMDCQIKKIVGNWDLGFVLHKHVLSSTYIGDDANGRPQFETTRSEPGEALFRLKYRGDWAQIEPLSRQLHTNLIPLFSRVEFIVPMPASNRRARQPVTELAQALGRLADTPVFENILVRRGAAEGVLPLKDMKSRDEKLAALAGRFVIEDGIANEGFWNVLLLDDLFDTGATMEAACAALRTYRKVNRVYAVAVTWS